MRIRGDSAADDVAKELSNRFKQYRIACQITQEELADKSMVSLSTIKPNHYRINQRATKEREDRYHDKDSKNQRYDVRTL